MYKACINASEAHLEISNVLIGEENETKKEILFFFCQRKYELNVSFFPLFFFELLVLCILKSRIQFGSNTIWNRCP